MVVVDFGVHLTTANKEWLSIDRHLECTVLFVFVPLGAAERPAEPHVLAVLVLVGGLVVAVALVLTVQLVNVLVDQWHLAGHQ